MNSRLLMTAAVAAAFAIPAQAGSATQVSSPMTLGETVALVQSLYPGKVTAAELDATGDKGKHYHVDVRFNHGKTARLEVDAVSGRIASRSTEAELAPGAMSMADALAFMKQYFPGEVTLAELDASDATHAHYHMDVRTPQGKTVRLRIDPMTRHVAARNPASLED